MTKAGIKTEDYRDITPYWCNRLLLYKGESKSKEFWHNEFFTVECTDAELLLIKYIGKGIVTFKQFTHNIMTLGSPKSTEIGRILKIKNDGINIGLGNTEWGAVKGKLYFIIKHGSIINQQS